MNLRTCCARYSPACLHAEERSKPKRRTKMKVKQAESGTELTRTDPSTEAENMKIKTPPIVSPEEWEAARQQLLVMEKELTHARDALAAERRRMPWVAVEKAYEFDGPKGKASLLDLFEGRRQL